MVFDAHEIYDEPDLDKLRIVTVDNDVAKAWKTWSADERHFIIFGSPADEPQWCSDPFQGRAHSAAEWLRERELRPRDAEGLLGLIDSAREVLGLRPHEPIPLLTILEFEKATES